MANRMQIFSMLVIRRRYYTEVKLVFFFHIYRAIALARGGKFKIIIVAFAIFHFCILCSGAILDDFRVMLAFRSRIGHLSLCSFKSIKLSNTVAKINSADKIFA